MTARVRIASLVLVVMTLACSIQQPETAVTTTQNIHPRPVMTAFERHNFEPHPVYHLDAVNMHMRGEDLK